MNMFYLDGKDTHVTLEPKKSFGEFLKVIRTQYDSPTSIIHGITVDGLEVGPEDEHLLNDVPLEHLNKIEVFTAHPREIAIETLQILGSYLQGIQAKCMSLAKIDAAVEFEAALMSVIENLCVFSDSVFQIKTVLNRHSLSEILILEADLHSILVDIKQMQELSQTNEIKNLSCSDLVKNLEQWRLTGIPAIIKSTDQ